MPVGACRHTPLGDGQRLDLSLSKGRRSGQPWEHSLIPGVDGSLWGGPSLIVSVEPDYVHIRASRVGQGDVVARL